MLGTAAVAMAADAPTKLLKGDKVKVTMKDLGGVGNPRRGLTLNEAVRAIAAAYFDANILGNADVTVTRVKK